MIPQRGVFFSQIERDMANGDAWIAENFQVRNLPGTLDGLGVDDVRRKYVERLLLDTKERGLPAIWNTWITTRSAFGALKCFGLRRITSCSTGSSLS